MRLFYSPTSPFVRKVLVLAHETGQLGQLELVPVVTSPTEPDPGLMARNPLVKLPSLDVGGGETLYDSRVICEYLDTLHEGRRLLPESGLARFRVLRLQALADGAVDAGLLVRYEQILRPEAQRSAAWSAAQARKIVAALDALEGEAPGWGAELDLGQIAVACALGWLEFRKPVGEFGAGRPRLWAWYERVRERPSLRQTEPR
ncbi:MAG TPA: glutathione S-transferase N-terminal domain-containing protein [Polyangiaceae bacterium]|nr:glutathione S-transferase N-terminal domain-containing protein [Polyangiaceae bacterium]